MLTKRGIPTRRFCDTRDRDCLTGDFIRSIFPDAAGGPAWVFAAHAYQTHRKLRDRSNLCATGKLVARCGYTGRRNLFWHVGRARRSVWYIATRLWDAPRPNRIRRHALGFDEQ